MLTRIRNLKSECQSRVRSVSPEAAQDSKTRRSIERLREEALKEVSEHKVELNKRFVFAMASLCFVLIGIPLGIRSQRSLPLAWRLRWRFPLAIMSWSS